MSKGRGLLMARAGPIARVGERYCRSWRELNEWKGLKDEMELFVHMEGMQPDTHGWRNISQRAK